MFKQRYKRHKIGNVELQQTTLTPTPNATRLKICISQ